MTDGPSLSQRSQAVLLYALAAALLVGLFAYSKVWVDIRETVRYPILADLFARSFAQGTAYPRWMPELNGGYGYPTFVFYQPLFFYLALPFTLLAGPLAGSFAAVYLPLVLGGMGAYLLARRQADHLCALAFGVLFLLYPHVAVNLFARGDLSELMAMMLCPWGLLTYLRLRDTLAMKHAVWLAAWTAAIIAAHPLAAFFWLLLLAALGAHSSFPRRRESSVPRPRREKSPARGVDTPPLDSRLRGNDGIAWRLDWRFPMMLAGAMLLAASLSAAYWAPLLQLKDAVNFSKALDGHFNTLNNLYPPFPMLLNLLDPHVVLAAAGFWLARRDPAVRFFAWAYLAGLLLTSTLSAPLWRAFGFLDFIQFPSFRIHAVLATVQLVGMVQLVRLIPAFGARFKGGLVYAIAVVGALTFPNLTFAPAPPHYAEEKAKAFARPFNTLTETEEFDPIAYKREGLADRNIAALPLLEPEGRAALSIEAEDTVLPIVASLDAEAGAELRINQLYFPGWQITLNDKPLSLTDDAWRIDDNGRMVVTLTETGTYRLRAWYDGPPGAEQRNAAAFFGGLAGIALLLISRRRAQKESLPVSGEG